MFKNLNRRWLWILDAVLFIGFLLSFWLDFTGLELHQWLGVILALAICYHFLTHLEWLAAVLRRFFKRTSSRARLNLSVDLLILTGMILILLSGLAVTTWFDFIWEPSGFLVTLHIAASISTLALLVVKIGLHWRWIVHTLRSALLPQWSLAWQTPALQTTAQSSSAGRRDFLVLMGITGAAALLSIVKPVETLSEERIPSRVSQTEDGLPSPDGLPSIDGLPASAGVALPVSAQNASDCWQRCAQNCTYPGNCRGYQDMDGNGLCDFGECV